MQKRVIWRLAALSLMFAMAGCASAPATNPTLAPQQPVQPVQPGVSASVEVMPAQVAELSFVLAAPVKEIAVKEGDEVQAGQTLIVLDAPDLAYAQVAAQAALSAAQEDEFIKSQGRRKWDGFKWVWLSGPPEERQEARARVVQAQAGLEVAQAGLAQAALTAPFDGTVVSIRASRGEIVQPEQVVLVIGALNHLRVETTDLSERAIAGVRVGQPAAIRLNAFENLLMGRVSAIAPMAGKSEDGDTVYKVSIELDEQPAELMWGMTGNVEISTP